MILLVNLEFRLAHVTSDDQVLITWSLPDLVQTDHFLVEMNMEIRGGAL